MRFRVHPVVIVRESGRSSIPELSCWNREAAAYWIPACAGMTAILVRPRALSLASYSSSGFLPPIVFSLANTASTLRSSRCFSDGSNSGSLRVVSEAGSRVAPP